MDIILKYFPDLSLKQKEQFSILYHLYSEWNNKINVISRMDIDNLYERHILHSLAIAKIIFFKCGTKIIDVGTGGGFPGIPLAILFPDADFTLVDSIGKKIKVVNEVKLSLKLTNVDAFQMRVENITEKYDFIVSRAVTALPNFLNLVRNIQLQHDFNQIKNGILYLKGGDFTDELKNIKKPVKIYNISDYFSEPFFTDKKVVYIQ